MSQFIESIAIKDGRPQNLRFHQDRVNRTFKEFFPTMSPHVLKDILTYEDNLQLIKCRVVYDARSFKVIYKPYQLPLIESVRIVHHDHIDYAFKSFDRSELKKLFKERRLCDDILIVRNGLLTDSYFANIALFDGHNWFTPDSPLLAGVKRETLIRKNELIPLKITAQDLHHFREISLINAMIDLGELVIPQEQVIYS